MRNSSIARRVVAIGVGLSLVGLLSAQTQTQDQSKYEPQVTEMGLATPAEQLVALKAWAERVPDSEFKLDRLIEMIKIYRQLGRLEDAYSVAKELKRVEPANINALYHLASLPVALNMATPERLAEAEINAAALESAIPSILAQLQSLPSQIAGARAALEGQVATTRTWVAEKRRQAQ